MNRKVAFLSILLLAAVACQAEEPRMLELKGGGTENLYSQR